jgi:PAS domain S-box-containing protein
MSTGQLQPAAKQNDSLAFIADGGEMGQLIREFDWANTPLGTPETWPLSLKTTVGIVLHSAFPMFLFWGKDLVCFYNDSFRPSLGVDGKHPAIGKPGKDVWGDIWEQIWPWLSQVIETGKPVFFEDQLVPFYRNGRTEEIYWTFSYSPAYGDDGTINGIFVTCFETTQKVRMLGQLEDSTRQFRNLIRDATVGIVVLAGQEKKVQIVNEAYGRLINRSVEELQDQRLWDVIPEAAAEFDPMLEQVRLTGKPVYLYEHPYSVYTGDKQINGFLNVVYQPFREADGTITGIMAMCQDVTEQVKDHRKAQDSELKVRSIVESAPFPIAVYTGREMRIELANQSIMDVWGKGYAVIGKTYMEVLPELDGKGPYEQLDSVYTTGVPFHARDQRIDLVISGKLQPFYFNYSFTPLYDPEGNIYGVLNTAADVTDLHLVRQQVEQSETNFRNMVLQAPVAMCILMGPDHVIKVVNRDMLEIWGKEYETVINLPVFSALPDAREQGLEQLMKKVYETGESFTAIEHPVQLFRNGNWETVYQNFVYDAYCDSDGTVLGILAISINVTPQVLARLKIEEIVAQRTQELAEANANLSRSNEELAQFAYIASHDLQEPVRKVATFAQMLSDHVPASDERAAGYLGKIQNAADRMLVLIRDVLAYSQLTRGQSGFTTVSLTTVMEEVVSDFDLLIGQKQAVVNWSSLPTVRAIPLQMSQLFGNLLSNSLKFAEAGKIPVISVTASAAAWDEIKRLPLPDHSRGYHHIRFTDNGIGFSPEYADKIFNIFQRLHGKKAYEGTGIGLATCRKIVQNHGGHIYATSVKGEGAMFHILLPSG